jgi:flagellar hook-length control protein FliK
MEVQGIAEKPIHVSIAVQGQEARVTLQAEQLQTQQILQASAPHLRELLQTQGMVLSSLTVGGSGAGAAGDGGGNAASRDPSGARQGQVLVPEATSAVTAAGGSGRSGSALDLFV